MASQLIPILGGWSDGGHFHQLEGAIDAQVEASTAGLPFILGVMAMAYADLHDHLKNPEASGYLRRISRLINKLAAPEGAARI